jgi:predicted hydrocarbon binding protein/ACT domain-containing protein
MLKKYYKYGEVFILVIPFSIQRFMFYRGRKLYGLVVEAISRPGVLAAVTLKVAEKGLDITYCSTRTVKAEERGIILLFIDFTDSEVDPCSLADEVKALDPIERVEVIKPTLKGYIADTVSFPLFTNSSRAVIMEESILRGLFLDFRTRLGSGGEAMLYHLGLEAGKRRGDYVNRMAEEIGVQEVVEKVEIASGIFRSLGYGIIEVQELRVEPPYAYVRIHRSIECELGVGADRPFSQFLRGAIAGLFTALFNREMFAEEKLCIAAGDTHCEFEVTPR